MEEQKTELKMIRMSEVESQEVKWLWYPFIPYGKLTIIQGDPGDGKTTLVLNIAAKLSKGESLDSDMNVQEPVNVIYQTAEDGRSGLSDDMEFYKGKIKDISDRTELLQEKADDLESVKRYAGAEQIDTIIRKVKEQERTEQQIRRYDRSYGTRQWEGWIDEMKDNRMGNIVECVYNMDNGYVEVWFTDGNMLRIKCKEVGATLRTTEQSLAKLHRLLDNKPIEYVAMAMAGEMQAYCDIEDDMVKGMFGTIVQGYLKKGYNRATAELMSREFFRYES